MLNPNKAESVDERTALARERNALANERTFSAWVRTGLTAVAAGVGIAELVPPVHIEWLTVAIGAMFVGGGILIFALAVWQYHFTARQLHLKETPSFWMLGLLIILFFGASILSLILLLL
jgi:putative membrane protein